MMPRLPPSLVDNLTSCGGQADVPWPPQREARSWLGSAWPQALLESYAAAGQAFQQLNLAGVIQVVRGDS